LLITHTNPLAAKTHPAQSVVDGYLHLGLDSDADGLPDLLEEHYASMGHGLSKTDPSDAAGDLDGDGVSNSQAYQYGWSLIGNLGAYDADGDRILDAIEDAWAASHSGSLDKHVFADAVADFDNDGVLNFEETKLGTSLANPATFGGPDLVFLVATFALDWQLPVSAGDADGDGMPDVWEHRYYLDLRHAADAGTLAAQGVAPTLAQDPDTDTLCNLQEFMLQTHPRIADSDHNGVSDPEEDFDEDGLSNAEEFAHGTNAFVWDSDGDGVSDRQEIAEGTDPLDAASNAASLLGLRVFTPINSL
jgi:hypothetical protein